jgi:hypothetical protein
LCRLFSIIIHVNTVADAADPTDGRIVLSNNKIAEVENIYSYMSNASDLKVSTM